MTSLSKIFSYACETTEEDIPILSAGSGTWYNVEVRPPMEADLLPESIPRFIREIMEIQSTFFGIRNASPLAAFEIRRHQPDNLQIQFSVPTKRLERKTRLHLSESIPSIGFQPGTSGLPITQGDTVSGGLLFAGREDMFPLQTSFDRPPTNHVVSALHRDAFSTERVIVQILFQPVAGRPLRRWLWTRRAYKRIGFLKKEKHAVAPWMDRPATKAEKKQVDMVEDKARNPRFHVAIRILLIGTPEEHVRSRIKEIGGAFNVYESPRTNQYLNTQTIKSLFPRRVKRYAESVAKRRMDGWTLPFQAGIKELAGLTAIPDTQQSNLQRASP